jgi:V/A-type H+-transporting ATPase subunit C
LNQTTLYASVLAKIGAERGNLLNETKLKALTEIKNLNLTELASQLRETTYQTQISKMTLPLTSRKLERALIENLIEAYLKIIKNSPRNAEKYLALYLSRFEVENIKVLIRATNAKLGMEQKLAKIYFTPEDYFRNHTLIEEAAKASTIKQMANVLQDTIYEYAMNMGLQSYEENASTVCLDVLLDKVFYEKLYESFENLPQKEKPHAYFYASTDNDSFTLMTLLRGKLLNYDANWLRLAVPHNNFDLSAETIEALLTASDFEAALKIILRSHYAKFFFEKNTPEETIANAEKNFKKAIFQHAKASKIVESFNICATLVFMTQKETEVQNLIALSLGIESAISLEEIQSRLLL